MARIPAVDANAPQQEQEQEQEEAPIHGDILEAILAHVPLVDLVPASHVSRSWSHAVCSSLRSLNKPKPWLILRTQKTRSPYTITSHAYDPRSHVWIEISSPSESSVVQQISSSSAALRSSGSDFLYTLSPSKLSYSLDPLHATWEQVDPPLLWRSDPIVARAGDSIIVAGGTCDFEDDPLAVEIYNMRTRTWATCDSMPSILKDSAASTWLSITATNDKMFVAEKHSGVMHWFDVSTKTWYGPLDLRPSQRIFYVVVDCWRDGLIFVGLMGEAENVEGVKIWRVGCENFECEEIGEMPAEYVAKLKSGDQWCGGCSVRVCVAGDYVYVSNAAAEVVVVGELGGCGRVKGWWSVRNEVAERSGMDRVVMTCAEIGLDELERVMVRSEKKLRFDVKVAA